MKSQMLNRRLNLLGDNCRCSHAVQYLCCELADLQQAGHTRALKVYDVAHVAWRMRVGTDIYETMTSHQEVRCAVKRQRTAQSVRCAVAQQLPARVSPGRSTLLSLDVDLTRMQLLIVR